MPIYESQAPFEMRKTTKGKGKAARRRWRC